MKRKIIAALLLLIIVVPGQAARSLREKINTIPPTQFESVSVFTTAINPLHEKYLQQYCRAFNLLNGNPNSLAYLVKERPQAIKIKIPIDGVWQELLLVRNEKIGDETRFTTKSAEGEQAYEYNDGVFYQGIVTNENQSVVALSFFNNDVMGFLSTPAGNYTIGQSNLWQAVENEYIIFNEKNALFDVPFHCETRNNPLPKNNSAALPEAITSKCVKLYVECDNKIYTDFSSNLNNATNYATSLLNNTLTLYLNDSIQAAVNQLTIWTTADPYLPATNTGDLLDSFASAMSNGFNGDIAHLMSRRSLGGGVAYLDILCLNIPYYQTGISASLNTTVTPLPAYSWNSTVITHEIGHNMASPHTHACAWNGNNTRIDNCAGNYNVAYQEGTCNSFPANPAGGGTIMSYCHLQAVGINLSLGFGPQPGALIRNTVNAGTCLGVCTECDADVVITGVYSTPLTESTTWIKSSGQTRIDSSATVTLDADDASYVLMQPLTAVDYFISAPQTASAFFKAISQDGCNGVAGKSINAINNEFVFGNEKLFSVYPNPTSTAWELIPPPGINTPISVTLLSVDGRMVWQGVCPFPYRIAPENIPNGIYLLQLHTEIGRETLKVIKQ